MGLADADGDGVAWRCLVRAADGLGDSEAGTLATAAWKGCAAQDPVDPAAVGSHSKEAGGATASWPVRGGGRRDGTAGQVDGQAREQR